MKHTPVIFSIALLALLSTACQQRDKQGRVLDTPTTGTLRVMVDEGYKPVIASAIDVFDSVYRQAHIDPVYTSEGEAINALLNDSVQVIIIPRQLKNDELEYFKRRGFTPATTAIAHDAVAFVLHPANADTVLTTDQLAAVINGTYANWNQVNPKSKLGAVRLVFDNALSGTVRYAKDTIGGGTLSQQASALNTNEEVIDYVGKNANAIGIIGANWISDTDDRGVQKFLGAIRIADIAKAPGATAYGPYQAYLAAGYYPYKRTVYIINAQARSGLGLGLATYLAGPDGQRIMLKDGLLPAQAPTRLIQVQH
jgi:phosphate transport system substrate-binding protein